MAERMFLSVDKTSITIEVSGAIIGEDYRFFCRLANNASDVSGDRTITARLTTISVTFSNLKAKTNYTCNAGLTVRNSDGTTTTDWIGAQSIITGSDRPENFTAFRFRAGQDVSNLTARDWNSFTDRINDFREYTETRPIYYSFTQVRRGDIITADIVSEAYDAISDMVSRRELPKDTIARGYPITADIFNDLQSALNSID